MIKSKKGFELSLEFMIKLFLFLLFMVFVGLPLIVRIYKTATGSRGTATINSMERMTKTIKYMEEGDNEIIPVYVDENHMIRGYDIKTEKPGGCDPELSCLCVCKKDGCTSQNIKKCAKIDYYIPSRKLHLTPLTIESTDATTNYLIELAGDTITITARPGMGT